MEAAGKKIKPMCGNCVHAEEWYRPIPGCVFCGLEGFQQYVDPYQRPCCRFEGWANPKYMEKDVK